MESFDHIFSSVKSTPIIDRLSLFLVPDSALEIQVKFPSIFLERTIIVRKDEDLNKNYLQKILQKYQIIPRGIYFYNSDFQLSYQQNFNYEIKKDDSNNVNEVIIS